MSANVVDSIVRVARLNFLGKIFTWSMIFVLLTWNEGDVNLLKAIIHRVGGW